MQVNKGCTSKSSKSYFRAVQMDPDSIGPVQPACPNSTGRVPIRPNTLAGPTQFDLHPMSFKNVLDVFDSIKVQTHILQVGERRSNH